MDALAQSDLTPQQSFRAGAWREPLAVAIPVGILAGLATILGTGIHPLLPFLLVIVLAAAALAVLRPMTALYVGLASMPLEAASLNLGALGVTPSEGMLTLTAVAWLLKRSASRETVLVNSPLTAPFALGLAIMAAGFLVSETPFQVVKVLAIWTVFFVLVQMVIAEGNPGAVRRVMIAVAFSGAAFGAVAVATGGGQELTEFGRVAEGRARVGFGSPNTLGEYLALAIPCQIAVLLRGPSALRLPMVLSIGLTSVGLGLTLSRGALIGIAGAMLVLLAWKPFRRVAVVAGATLLAATVIGFNPIASVLRVDVLVERVTSIQYEAQLNPRRVALQNSPNVIADHPLFGVGAGSLASVAPEYKLILQGAPMDNAHNMLLHVGAERGLLGLGAFIWLLAAFGRSAVNACRRSVGENQAYAFAIAASWLSLLLAGLADAVLLVNAVAATAFVLMACAVVLDREADRAERADPKEGTDDDGPVNPWEPDPVAEARA